MAFLAYLSSVLLWAPAAAILAVSHYQAFPNAQDFSNTLPSFTLQSKDRETCHTGGCTEKYLSTFQEKNYKSNLRAEKQHQSFNEVYFV